MGDKCDCGRDHGPVGGWAEFRVEVVTPRAVPGGGGAVDVDSTDVVALADFGLRVDTSDAGQPGYVAGLAGDLAAFYGYTTRLPVRVRFAEVGAAEGVYTAQATHEGSAGVDGTQIGYREGGGLRGPFEHTPRIDTTLRAGLVAYQQTLRERVEPRAAEAKAAVDRRRDEFLLAGLRKHRAAPGNN